MHNADFFQQLEKMTILCRLNLYSISEVFAYATSFQDKYEPLVLSLWAINDTNPNVYTTKKKTIKYDIVTSIWSSA